MKKSLEKSSFKSKDHLETLIDPDYKIVKLKSDYKNQRVIAKIKVIINDKSTILGSDCHSDSGKSSFSRSIC